MNPAHRIHPELHGIGGNEYYRRYQAKRRAERQRSGLTWDGKPRVRKIRFDLAGMERNPRHVITNRERRRRFIASGLTWLGKARVRFPISATEQQWRALRLEIQMPASADWDFFDLRRQS